ncbi:MAG: hypothetical protein ACR2F1_15590 [Nitrososphaeraceae archaeon]
MSSNDLTLILYVIGKSERPLTSQEIRNQIDISNSKKKSGWYGHEILKELVPIERIRNKRIFVLEEILSKDIEIKRKSINKLEKALELNWNTTKQDVEIGSVKVKEETNKTKKVDQSLDLFIELYYGTTRKITITNKDREDKELASVIISEGDQKELKSLFIEKNQQKKLTVYTIKKISRPVNYLDITYDNETKKLISSLENDRMPFFLTSDIGEVIKGIKQEDWNLEKEIKSIKNIAKIESDRSKWKYSLNLRGFLYYLRSENHSNIIRIKEVLSNPTITDKFIFLKEWETFEKNGFKVIEKLLEIANEFEKQLEKYDERNLLIRVTERYLSEIDNYFSKYGSFFHSTLFLTQETGNILNQYRLIILEFLKKELVLTLDGISQQIRYIKSVVEY